MLPEASYKVIGETKIPVSKSTGKFWSQRLAQAKRAREQKGLITAWDLCQKYFENDQSTLKVQQNDDTGENEREFWLTENIVFSNTTAIASAVYNRNPQVEVTYNAEEFAQLANLCEKLIDAIFSKRSAPGVNLKPKLRRAVISAAITNAGWLEVGWNFKKDSSEAVLEELSELSEQFSKASPEELRKIEGKFAAIQDKMDFLTPEGPYVKTHDPRMIFRDPLSIEEDLSDANWVMIGELIPTNYLRAVYADDEGKSLYEPTHVLAASTEKEGYPSILSEYRAFDRSQDFSTYGFASADDFRSAQVTLCWKIWDKVTRRVYMYADNSWDWPIWVWDDPLKLDCFFPLVNLNFYYSNKGGETKGEVSYYLRQQDALNFMNYAMHRARVLTVFKFLYDKNKVNATDLERMLNNDELKPIPVDVPEGMTLDQMSPRPFIDPAAQLRELFDKSGIYQQIQRISSAGQVLVGEQFKTNTTNRAIQSYENSQSNRLDMPIDAVEEAVSQIGWMIMQLCLMYMSQEQVAGLVGAEAASQWKNLDWHQIRNSFTLVVQPGSTLKPTSEVKQKMALELGQVLGQFAAVSPVVLMVVLRVISKAFDEVVIGDKEWQMILGSIEQSMTKGQTNE